MITTLLLDLDGTLLANDMQRFIPAYLSRLGTYMANLAPAERFTKLLLQATRVMMENADPERTLEQAFAESFYPSLGIEPGSVKRQFEAFYAEEFPLLRSLTAPLPQAPVLVDAAAGRGLELVIATNPLFPRTAVKQRLEWAGFPATQPSFCLIASYEAFRFCKPNPAYFAEILGRLGRQSHQAAMVGDDFDADIGPARVLGLPAFHVASAPAPGGPGGSLDKILAWLDSLTEDQAQVSGTIGPQGLLARLRGYLAALLDLTSSLDEQSWQRRPAPKEWSTAEVVCHMRDVELEVHQPRLRAVLMNDNPFIPAAEPDRWAAERDYASQSPSEALQAFVQARKQTLSELEALEPAAWLRPARHALLGPTNLAELLGVVADHDLLHLAQVGGCLHEPAT